MQSLARCSPVWSWPSLDPVAIRSGPGRCMPGPMFRGLIATLCLGLALFAQSGTVVPIGAAVDAPFLDVRWQARRISELRGHAAIVVYFATVECPMVRRYMPRLGEIAREYSNRGVATVVANVGAGDSFLDAAAQVVEHAPAAIFAKDEDHSLARACGVDRCAAVVVLDGDLVLRYRGRIDDQHGYSGTRDKASPSDLRVALEDVLARRPVSTPETAVTGCRLTLPAPPDPANAPTWAKDVAPIVGARCVGCHDAGGSAPFALTREADVRKHGAMIAEVVGNGRMPPWYAASTHGGFANSRRLSLAEREIVRHWVAAGMPSGDSSPLASIKHPMKVEWRVARPDLVIQATDVTRIPASGALPYQYMVLPHVFEKDTWVESIEVKSECDRSLHHCNVARVRAGATYDSTGFIANHVPHGSVFALEPGTALRIPAGSALALQAYYVSSGTAEVDRLRVALRYPRAVVRRDLRFAFLSPERIEVPAGAMAHPVTASFTLAEDAIGLNLFAHMHLRGRDVMVTATAASGDAESLLLAPSFHFAGQQAYVWPRGGKTLSSGTSIAVRAHFDNSSWNPFNPDPGRVVPMGSDVTDEQLFVSLAWVARADALDVRVDPSTGHAVVDVGGAGDSVR